MSSVAKRDGEILKALVERTKRESFFQISLILVAVILHSGIWFIPNLGNSLLIIQNPFTNPPIGPDGQYIFSTWLFHFVGFLVGANTYPTLIFLSAVFSISFFVLVILEIRKTVSAIYQTWSIAIFCFVPASFTSFYWLGMDSLTLLLLILAFRYRSNAALAYIFAVLLGIQHFEQSLIAMALLTLCGILMKERAALKSNAVFLTGVISGKLFFELGMKAINVHYAGRLNWFQDHIGFLFQTAFLNFPSIAWSLFGLAWLPILKFLFEVKNSRKLAVPIAITLLFAFLAADQTRVMAIISFPFVIKYLLLNEQFLKLLPPLRPKLIFAIFLISPVVWVWGGLDRGSIIFKDLAFISGYFLHLFPIPTEFSLWPFI